MLPQDRCQPSVNIFFVPNAPQVRVRFAPSPTGHLHVGNARTALFNWLYARQHGGIFVLRIEDTDLERSEARFEEQLLQDMRWMGIDWDEGPDVGGPYAPYRQSDRMQVYDQYAERLLAEGKAYLCFCTAEELEEERQRAQAQHRSPAYSGKCRLLDAGEAEQRRSSGVPCAVRLRIPEHPIRFHDLVRGAVEFPNEAVSDPIIVRSTGMPVYNYVVVIDDIEMKITHVVRGDDHLSNTPKQVALYEALGLPAPEFAHLSTILGSDRERLSKRHGATSIANFREMGILPEALVNYLALLGWAPHGGDREIFSTEELIQEFSLERVTPSPAIFDFQKLYWLNRHYIQQCDPERLAHLAASYFTAAGLIGSTNNQQQRTWFLAVMALLAPSVDKLEDLLPRSAPIFRFDPADALAQSDNQQVLAWEKTPSVLESFTTKIGSEPEGEITAARFKELVNAVKQESGAKGKELFHPIRVMLTGSHSGPEFDKLVPLIEQGSRLGLPQPIPDLRQRAQRFMEIWKARS